MPCSSASLAEVANNIACAIEGARLDYCNSLLDGTSKTNIVKLRRLQNFIARVVTSTRKFGSITPVFRSLYWLPIQSIYTYKVALLTCKALPTGQPEYLASLRQWHEPTRVLRSSACQQRQGVGTAIASRAFSCTAPEI